MDPFSLFKNRSFGDSRHENSIDTIARDQIAEIGLIDFLETGGRVHQAFDELLERLTQPAAARKGDLQGFHLVACVPIEDRHFALQLLFGFDEVIKGVQAKKGAVRIV